MLQLSGVVGQAERRLREAFATAREEAEAGRPVVIFVDEASCLSISVQPLGRVVVVVSHCAKSSAPCSPFPTDCWDLLGIPTLLELK